MGAVIVKVVSNVVFILATLAVSACSTVEIEGAGSITPDAITGSETVHGSLYGYRWKPTSVEKCGTDNLFRVETHTNAGLLLISVLSLGVYVPQTVEWWCHSAASDNDDEEVWDPGSYGDPNK